MSALAVAQEGARGGSPARLGSNVITVTIDTQRLSTALAPLRAARAADLRDKARWLKVNQAFAMGSGREISVAGRWHLQRADGLEVAIVDRLLECGGKCAQFMSPDGEVIEIASRCGQRLCPTCNRARAHKLARRVKLGAPEIDALEAALRAQAREEYKQAVKAHALAIEESAAAARLADSLKGRRGKGDERRDALARKRKLDRDARKIWANAVNAREKMKHRKLELVTFTLRHRDENATLQAQILRTAWPLFRARIQKRLRKALSMCKFEEASGKETGHVHWHALVWLPPVCWAWLHEAWRGSVNSARAKLGLDKMGCPGNVDVSEHRTDAGKIAAYGAKAYHYAAKGSLTCEGWETSEATEYLDFCYGRRLFTASPGRFPTITSGFEFMGFRAWDGDGPPRPILQAAHAPTGPPLYVS